MPGLGLWLDQSSLVHCKSGSELIPHEHKPTVALISLRRRACLAVTTAAFDRTRTIQNYQLIDHLCFMQQIGASIAAQYLVSSGTESILVS